MIAVGARTSKGFALSWASLFALSLLLPVAAFAESSAPTSTPTATAPTPAPSPTAAATPSPGLTHRLVISKSNDAPIQTLDLPDGSKADLPTADPGDTVTFTLHFTFSGDPVTNGQISDVLPNGLTYVPDSATDGAQFTFDSYDSATRTLTWDAASVSASGNVTYKATVDVRANVLPQPLENVAAIKSDQTPADSDSSDVFVPAPPLGETFKPTPHSTPPPTDTLAPTEPSDPGVSLTLLLAVLGALVAGVMVVTPVPAVVRRRKKDRR